MNELPEVGKVYRSFGGDVARRVTHIDEAGVIHIRSVGGLRTWAVTDWSIYEPETEEQFGLRFRRSLRPL